MKKNKLFYVMVFSGLCIGSGNYAAERAEEIEEEMLIPEQAFEDKPALNWAERAALWGAKGIGTIGGVYLGGSLGLSGGFMAAQKRSSYLKQRERAEEVPGSVYRHPQTPKESKDQEMRESIGFFARGGIPGAVIGGGIGTYAGFKGGGWAAIRLLAKLHGVSKRVEEVSQFYNINVPQYRAVLRAAEHKDQEQLLAAINDLYLQRFGSNWQERLQKLFKKYRRKSKKLVEKGSFSLEGDERDFVRMVELGAAMENLYSDTKLIYNALDVPNKEAAIGFAKELYEDLGVLK